MSLVQANWQPTHRQLRQFGLLCALALPCVAWLWSLSASWFAGLSAAGVLLALLSWYLPVAVAPLFIGVMLITLPIGLVVSEIVLLLVYALVFVPIGVAFRCLGRDRLERRIDRSRDSYWEPKLRPRSLASYYRQS
ncbi:MAG: hypothetical protein IT422_09295 [Pirellulaceae bacterium]|jgi:hypothetical protein|nr:hypothetical protein [Pirellulaceae bacterium]